MPHNLNMSASTIVEGESLIMGIKELAVSSGSACTSASLEPSYVLRALGRSDELAHSSIRFTIGRFTTEARRSTHAIDLLKSRVGKLRDLSPLWDMFKDGVEHGIDPVVRALSGVERLRRRPAALRGAREPRVQTYTPVPALRAPRGRSSLATLHDARWQSFD